jgi:hypothetical protein
MPQAEMNRQTTIKTLFRFIEISPPLSGKGFLEDRILFLMVELETLRCDENAWAKST